MMKETYLLQDLIKFWQRQMGEEFAVLQAIVNLFESPYMDAKQKEAVALETLRTYGLFEIGYKGDRSFLMKSTQPIISIIEESKQTNDAEINLNGVEVPLEIYRLDILNGRVELIVIPN